MLLAFFPSSMKGLPVWVVEHALAVALIVLEVADISLAVRPHVGSFAVFATLDEHAVEEASVRPLEEPVAMHRVLQEWSLVDLPSRRDAASPAVDLTFVELTFENRIVGENLEAHAVGLGAFETDLPAVLRATLPGIPVLAHDALRADIVLLVIVFKVVERTQRLVYVSHALVLNRFHNKLVVLQRKVMVHLLNVGVETLSEIDLDVVLYLLKVFLYDD